MNRTFLIQVTKYGIVGIMNVLLTAVAIWVMMYLVFRIGDGSNVSPSVITVSNTTGFIAGVINSFYWNRKWTFQSKNSWKSDFIRFIAAFLICYFPQLLLVNFLNTYTNLQVDIGPIQINHANTCQGIGIVFYTSINFLLNKFYAFKQK